jgi:hypothetical protein
MAGSVRDGREHCGSQRCVLWCCSCAAELFCFGTVARLICIGIVAQSMAGSVRAGREHRGVKGEGAVYRPCGAAHWPLQQQERA